MNFEMFFSNVGVKVPDNCFEKTFESAVSEYSADGVFFLNDKYIDYVNSFCDCFSNCITQVKEAAENLKKRESLAKYALFVYRAMTQRDLFIQHLEEFEFPYGEECELRLLPFLVLLPAIPDIFADLEKRNVPCDVIATTLRQFEDCIYLTKERTGTLGYLKRYFDHMQRYIDGTILNIGRLRFQMVPRLMSNFAVLENHLGEWVVVDKKIGFSDTDYPKSEWKTIFENGDSVLSVHIPNKGTLTSEACEESYCRAKEIFAKSYPEFKFKAFYCHSWLLDPQLRELLSEHSNILAFQKKYTFYFGKTQGNDVFNFVFKTNYEKDMDFNCLSEDTSLQRALKNHYINGKQIYEYEAVFLNTK